MIKERPILMSGMMVNAILDCRKTQTRRVIKKQVDERFRYENDSWVLNDEKQLSGTVKDVLSDLEKANIKCPYGKAGDRLWVRETFCYKGDDCGRKIDGQYWYLATNPNIRCVDGDGFTARRADGWEKSPWKASIHMPRRASRILLEITGVRVERLQDISEDDAIAEGVEFDGDYDLYMDYESGQLSMVDGIDSFESLINKIQGKETWERNPWVWVVEFKALKMKGESDES